MTAPAFPSHRPPPPEPALAEKPTEGVVYVIGNADNRLVKIGTTTKHKLERLAGIQTMSPSILTVLWTTPGDVELEHKLHYRFRAERRHGEWFDFGGTDPVASVAAAAREIAATLPEPPQRSTSLSDLRNTLRRSVQDVGRRDSDAAPQAGAIADGFSLLSDGADELAMATLRLSRHAPYRPGSSLAIQAAQALKQARDFLDAEHLEEDDDLRESQLWSPAAVLATAANALFCVQQLDAAIGNDPFTLHDVGFASAYLSTMSSLAYVLRQSLGMTAAAIDAWPGETGLAQKATAEFDDIRHLLELASGKLGDAARICWQGKTGSPRYDEARLRTGILAELEARDLTPTAHEPSDGSVVAEFMYQGVPCRILHDQNFWRAAPSDGEFWPRGAECGPFDLTYHPAQVVSWALLAIDYMLARSGPVSVHYDPKSYVESGASPVRVDHGATP